MIDELAAAIDRQDYPTAAHLLKQLQLQAPDNPWVQFYAGRLQEATGHPAEAASLYRQLLKATTHPKVIGQTRQRLQNLQTAQVQPPPTESAKSAAKLSAAKLSAAKPKEAPNAIAYLILEPVSGDRSVAAQAFAKILKLDPYTARLQLPSRGWRLYRIGEIGEVQSLTASLQKVNIPAFWAALSDVEQVRTFRVRYVQAASPKVTVICDDESDRLGSLSFDWSEVSACVEGRLPVFEQVVDLGVHNQLKRKEQTQDYAQICDLHLPQRHCILRLCDRSYEFQHGVVLDASRDGEPSAIQGTTYRKWQALTQFLQKHLDSVATPSDFTAFAETAIDLLDLGKPRHSYIDLFRRAPTNWDAAFHLYSCLVLSKTKH